MRRFILLIFIGVFLTKSVTPSKIYEHSNLARSLGLNDKSNDSKQETRTVCQTEECKKIANIMLESMNRSVDPCDDFYEYACGKWPEHNPIPENGKVRWSSIDKFQMDINRQVTDVLSSGIKDSDLFAVRLAKTLYMSCIDTDAMDKQGLHPLVSTISRIGGWPMVMEPDEWNEQEYSWQKVDDQYMRLTGRNTFHDIPYVHLGSRITNSTEKRQRVVYISTPHLPPGANKLQSNIPLDSDEDLSDEEEGDSQEPGSEGEDDSKDDESYYDYGSGDSEEEDSSYEDDNQGSGSGDEDDSNYENGSYDYYDYGSGDSDEYNSLSSGDYDSDDDDDYGSGYSNDDYNDNASGDYDNDNDDNSNGNSCDDDDDGSDYIDIDNDIDIAIDIDIDIDNNNLNEIQDRASKEKVSKRKIINKIVYRKKLGLDSQKKSGIRIIKKHDSHQMKKQRMKWQTIPTKAENKREQRFTHSEKINVRKNERNHVKKLRTDRKKKVFDNVRTMSSAASRINAEKTSDKMTRQKYVDYIAKVARIIAEKRGTKISQEHLDKDIEDMINFQLDLMKIKFDLNLYPSLKLTLGEFQQWYNKKKSKTANSKIDWIYKIKELFDEARVSVDKDLNLQIIPSSYFKALVSLLDKTSSRTIVNYVHWNFISQIIQTTTNEMRELYYSWADKDKSSSRSMMCASSSELKHLLAYEFVGKYFSDDIARTAFDMLDDIQKEVEYLIKESDWMDDDAKDFALSKLIYLSREVGYPDWYKNSTIIRRLLRGLIIGKSYYENTLSYARYVKWKYLRKLTENIEETSSIWNILDPTIVNAAFSPWKNTMIITAADFQSPFFAYDRPQAINFGLVGSVMAHEINHGFDSRGHMYDKNGEYMGLLSEMAESYGERANCFVEQFNNYPIDKASNKKIENYGNQTLQDNIADTMGLQAIFKAYQRRERECGKSDSVLPGMEDFTNDQLFFLSFAYTWCETIKPEKIINEAKSNVHSIGRLRVIGPVSNSDDFAKAFNCPIGSPMNPEKKCNIWK